MRLNHNTLAYVANRNLRSVNNNVTKSMQRLSSGYKITKSADDPAGKAISQRMNAQLRGLDRATNNANDGISLIQTAEGALDEVHSILGRMRELAVQAANETFDESDRDAMQDEIASLQDEIDRIAETTDFNGRKLLNGELNKKGYTDNDDLSIVEIGGDIESGVYGLTVTQNGEPARTSITPPAAGASVTAVQEGILWINDFEIRINQGMTSDEVNEAIRNATDKIGIDYNPMTGEMVTKESGSEQSIVIKTNNDQLKALLGVNGQEVYGSNAKAEFSIDGVTGERIGFRATATLETQGNRITVTDKAGFKMVYDVAPGSADSTNTPATTVEANITVLSAGPLVFQIGNNEGQILNVNINKTTAEALEIDKINIYTNKYASKAIGKIDAAIEKVSSIRSSLGAYQNRLDHTVTNLETSSENLTSAVSRIQDTDVAEEITKYTEQNVLSQTALQMLIKSNARPEGLLQLFQR